MRQGRIRLMIVIIVMMVLSIGCNWPGSFQGVSASATPGVPVTRPVNTPTAVSTETIATRASTPTASDGEVASELTRVPLPTPRKTVTPWDDIIDSSIIEAIRWVNFQSRIQGGGKGVQVPISVAHPAGWYISPHGGHTLSIQNEPPESFPEYQGPFVKFEVLWLKTEPKTSSDLEDAKTALISGENSILWEGEWLSTRTIGALVRTSGASYLVKGYISRVDEEQYQLYRNVLLYMISTLEIGN